MRHTLRSTFLRGVGKARRLRGHCTIYFKASPAEALAAGAGDTRFGALFFAHQGRSIYKWTDYLAAYDEQLERFRPGFPVEGGGHRPLRVLELGVLHGGSLQVWREYFGPDAAIWGIDINPLCAAVDDPDLEVRIGSQADRQFLEGVVAEMGGVDLVIDDGSHVAKHQRTSFEVLFPLLSDGGLYVVEDTQTSFWWDYGGGYRRRGSFLSLTKDLIDDMHAHYHGHRSRSPVHADRWIPKLTVYDGMVVIQKKARARPMVVQFGQESY